MTPIRCKHCKHCVVSYRAKKTDNNRHSHMTRFGFSCDHGLAIRNHESQAPRSGRTRAFIGFSKLGETLPKIKTYPRWCPLVYGEIRSDEEEIK